MRTITHPMRHNFLMDTIGDRVKAERTRLGWSMAQLGQKAGLSTSAIRDIENRNNSTFHLLTLARVFKVNPFWLESGKGRKEWVTAAAGDYVAADTLEELVEQLSEKPVEDVARMFAELYAKAHEK